MKKYKDQEDNIDEELEEASSDVQEDSEDGEEQIEDDEQIEEEPIIDRRTKKTIPAKEIIRQKPVQNTNGTRNYEQKAPVKKGERYEVIHNPERIGIVDTVTEEVISLYEFPLQAKASDVLTVQNSLKLLNQQDKIIIAQG